MMQAREMFVIMFILNVSMGLVNELPFLQEEKFLTPFNETQVIESLDAEETISTWNWPGSGSLFGDIKAFLMFAGKLRFLILGCPDIISSLGIFPPILNGALTVIWFFGYWLSIIYAIRGK